MLEESVVWTSAVIVAALAIMQMVFYVRAVKRGDAQPATSSWIVWFVGSMISTITYVLSQKAQLVSGARLLVDCGGCGLTLVSVLIWGDRKVRFRSFEKWYLLGCAGIVAYGAISGDMFGSNLYAQGLLVLGYLPTIQKLITEKRNSEPFGSWIIALALCFLGFLPAVLRRDTLAMIYAGRSFTLVSCTIALMILYDRRQRRLMQMSAK